MALHGFWVNIKHLNTFGILSLTLSSACLKWTLIWFNNFNCWYATIFIYKQIIVDGSFSSIPCKNGAWVSCGSPIALERQISPLGHFCLIDSFIALLSKNVSKGHWKCWLDMMDWRESESLCRSSWWSEHVKRLIQNCAWDIQIVPLIHVYSFIHVQNKCFQWNFLKRNSCSMVLFYYLRFKNIRFICCFCFRDPSPMQSYRIRE